MPLIGYDMIGTFAIAFAIEISLRLFTGRTVSRQITGIDHLKQEVRSVLRKVMESKKGVTK